MGPYGLVEIYAINLDGMFKQFGVILLVLS